VETARGEGLVLVIDDEVAIRSAVQNSLEDLGYTVLTA
jgi:CheY-like chemotaxis protein